MKFAISLLLVLFVIHASISANGEAVLKPPKPKKTTNDKKSDPDSSGIFEEIDKALAEDRIEDTKQLLALAELMNREVSPVFLEKNFATSLQKSYLKAMRKRIEIESEAKEIALRFVTAKPRILADNFFSFLSTSEKESRMKTLLPIARNVARFEHFAEDYRIEGFRIQFALERKKSIALARDWLKGSNNALRIASIFALGYSENSDFVKPFSKKATDEKIPIELRIEYAFSAEKLGGEGISIIQSALLNEKVAIPNRFRCINLLSFLNKQSASPILIQLITSEAVDARIATKAINILSLWEDQALAPHLGRFLKSKNSQLKEATINAIGKLKVTRIISEVAGVLEYSENAALISASILCISRCESVEFVPLVAKNLYHRNFSVRLEAALAIQSLMKHDFGLERLMNSVVHKDLIHKVRLWWQEYTKSIGK